MKLLLSILVTFACLYFRCGAEMMMVEEEISIQQVIRKYIPTYTGSKVMGSRSGDPFGNATSCGPPQAKIVMTWKPTTVVIGESLSVNIQMIAPADLVNGTGTANIYIAGESTPFAGFSFDGGCETLKKQGITGLTCPIKKNDQIKMHYTVPESATQKLMTGHFVIKVKVQNDKKQEFACVRVDVKVAGSKTVVM
ncbi:uncharacterized protein LOC110451109 [Mizuhopecten yessoensis]|uniref:MD-2-related lipid-recognition domain-containing protein n=1 Tax=Mizuhopecten yessoensis TaxID=6573 RepID=A0A210QMB6_MIZYE|nr:uncharacterized protein LOC110451109 [Mizuhopecten yessoensis]XP_021354643.1 uncharacterized protein LOC110451109 [Mizuhopecten yessoensis]OWF49873.1 hypothetical protein KP79_PYT13504 [Mizuhopecten yessoensis]